MELLLSQRRQAGDLRNKRIFNDKVQLLKKIFLSQILLIEMILLVGGVSRSSLEFKSWAGQIGRSVANCSPPPRHFFKGAVLPADAMTLKWASTTRYTLRRNTARLIKILI